MRNFYLVLLPAFFGVWGFDAVQGLGPMGAAGVSKMAKFAGHGVEGVPGS